MAAIRVEDMSIGWGDAPLLEHLDFEVAEGDVFLVLGGSGSGKSTLLRSLIGLQAPLSGRAIVGGAEPALGFGRPAFGVMFQSGALFGSMTVAENVALPLRRWSGLDERAIETVVRWKLQLVGLDGFENHMPSEISGGMRKRAGIARALALETPLLFLDEPSAGLDPVTAVELDELLLTLNASLGTTLVVVTHELESIFKIGRTCIVLDQRVRGIVARGDPRDLRDHPPSPEVDRFFNRLPARV